MTIDIKQIKNEVTKLLSTDKSGHDDEHAFRVYNIASKLNIEEKADSNIVSLAALLHDCDDYKLFGQINSENLINAKDIMCKCGIDPNTQIDVCEIIKNMGYSKLLKGIRPNNLEGKIVSDADMLDGMGAIGIIRGLLYTINKCNGSYFDKDNWPRLDLTATEYKQYKPESGHFINHFFEKSLKLKNLMLTNSGKKEAAERHKIMIDFLHHFFIEQDLFDWDSYLNKFLKENNL